MADLEPDELSILGRHITCLLKNQNYSDISVGYKDFLLQNATVFLINPKTALEAVLL